MKIHANEFEMTEWVQWRGLTIEQLLKLGFITPAGSQGHPGQDNVLAYVVLFYNIVRPFRMFWRDKEVDHLRAIYNLKLEQITSLQADLKDPKHSVQSPAAKSITLTIVKGDFVD